MGKGHLSRSPAVSRSGLWLIGGALLLSAGVLAWAFQEEPTGAGPRDERAVTGARSAARNPSAPAGRGAGETLAARPPAVSEYGALLGHNVFRPLVTPEDRATHPPRPAPVLPPAVLPGAGRGVRAGNEVTASWRGWRFNGVADLDQKTYALMDQPGQKRSRFVQPGDRLEDAVVASVEPDSVVLRPAEGGVVSVTRVDAMAELLRPSRSPSGAPRAQPLNGAPGLTVPRGAPGSAAPIVTGPDGQEITPAAAPDIAALEAEARRARRERRLRERSDDQSTRDEASSEE